MAVAPFGLGVMFYAKDKLSPAMARLSANYESFGKRMGMVDSRIKQVGNSITDLKSKFAQFFISGTIAQMGLAFGQSWVQGAKNMAKFGTALSNNYAQFETINNRIKLATGANEKQMKQLQDNAYKVGIATMYSWSEASEAQRLLISKGTQLSTVLDSSSDSILNSIVYLSEATGKTLSLADTTNLLISAQQRFNLTTNAQTRTMANQYAMMLNMGAEAKDLLAYSQAMGGIPSYMGARPEELMALLTTMKKFGVTARYSGLAVSSFYQDLMMIQKRKNIYEARKLEKGGKLKTPALVSMFEKTGVQIWDKQGKGLPAMQIIAQFLDKMKDPSTKKSLEAMGVLNKRSQSLLALLSTGHTTDKKGNLVYGMEALNETLKKLDPNSKGLVGYVEKISSMQRMSVKGVEDYFKSVMDSLKTIFGKPASEIRKAILYGIARPLEQLGLIIKDTDIPKRLIQLGAIMIGLVGSMGIFTVGVFSVALFVNAISMLKAMIIATIPFMKSFSLWSNIMSVGGLLGLGGSKAAIVSNAMLKGAVSPVSAVTGAFTGMASGGILANILGITMGGIVGGGKATKDMIAKDIKNTVTNSGLFANNTMKGAGGKFISTKMPAMSDVAMLGMMSKGWGYKAKTVYQTYGKQLTIMEKITLKLSSAWGKVGAGVKNFGVLALTSIGSVLRVLGLFLARLTLIGAILLTVYAAWKTGLFGVKDAIVGVWSGIVRAVSIATAIMSGDMNKVKEKFGEIKKSGSDAYSDLGISIGRIATQIKLFFAMLGGGKKVREHLTPKYDKMMDKGDTSPFTKMWTDTMFGTFKALGIKTSIKEKGYSIPKGLAKTFYEAGGTKEDIMGMAGLLDSLTGLKDSINKLVTTIFPDMSKDFKFNVRWLVNKISELIGVLNNIIEPIKWLVDTIKILVDTLRIAFKIPAVDWYKNKVLDWKSLIPPLKAFTTLSEGATSYISGMMNQSGGNYDPQANLNTRVPMPIPTKEDVKKSIQKSGTKFSAGVNFDDNSKTEIKVNATGYGAKELSSIIANKVRQEMLKIKAEEEIRRQQFATMTTMGNMFNQQAGAFMNVGGQ